MKVLVLGGTGAMGTPLVEQLSRSNILVYVTSRSVHEDRENVRYLRGNAKNLTFLKTTLNFNFDSIIDFMSYSLSEFNERINLFLDSTDQYIFLSSCRVYANTNRRITEKSPRLLDVSNDKEYLSTREYSLEKAREENLLIGSSKKNWTILRPYITYGSNRLQLGIYEKELWLSRVISGKPVVVPKSILQHETTLTLNSDVSKRISALVGKTDSLGEIFNITSNEHVTWQHIIDIYSSELFRVTGQYPMFVYSDDSKKIANIMSSRYQLVYDRLFDRTFDNSKIEDITGNCGPFASTDEGLRKSIRMFMNGKKKIGSSSWVMKAYMDKYTNESTSIKNIRSISSKAKYLIARYTPYINIHYALRDEFKSKGGG